jgi:hypothetical protein
MLKSKIRQLQGCRLSKATPARVNLRDLRQKYNRVQKMVLIVVRVACRILKTVLGMVIRVPKVIKI